MSGPLLPTNPAPSQPVIGPYKVGDVKNGYIFQGGDWRQPTSWKLAAGDVFLNSLPIPDTQKALIRGIASYDYAPGGTRSLGSPEAQQVLGLVKMYDPNFDAKQYKVRGDFLHDMNDAKTRDQIANLTNAALHAHDLSKAWDTLGNRDSLPAWANEAGGYGEGMFGSVFGSPDASRRLQNMGAATDAANFLAPEAARVGMGSAPNEAEIAAMRDQLQVGAGPSTQAGTLGDIAGKIAQRLLTIQNNYRRAFGNVKPTQPLIDPHAASAIHDLLTRYGRPEKDELDYNTLTAGGYTPTQAKAMMGTGGNPSARPDPLGLRGP